MGFLPVQPTQMRFQEKWNGFLRGSMAIWQPTNSKVKSKTCHSYTPAPNHAIHNSWATFLILILRNLSQWSLISDLDCWWSPELQWEDELLFYLSAANKEKHKHRGIWSNHLIGTGGASSLASEEQRDIGHCISHWYFSYSNLYIT